MPNVEIVAVGTELLLGQLVDTNSTYIARTLADAGIDVFAKHAVGDNAERLEAMLRGALERAEGVVTSGGLGPTVDDVTREAVAAAVEAPLVLDERCLRAVEQRLARFGVTEIGENNRRQAYVPEGAVVVDNPHGSAPGFIALRRDGRFVACMPGVPHEMRAMLSDSMLPWMVRRLGAHAGIFTRTLHLVGIGESEVDRRIDDLFRTLENPKIAVLAHVGRVDVKIMAKAHDREEAEGAIAPVERELRRRVEDALFGADEETLESAIVRRASELEVWIATAESLTGGGVADAIVRAPGASGCFRGGVVAYDNAVKVALLGVDEELLRTRGAVSEEVATAMARGARDRLGADIAVATTGIAGPAGATAERPVGLVYVGLCAPDGVSVREVTLPGERSDIRARSVTLALNVLWRALRRLAEMKAR